MHADLLAVVHQRGGPGSEEHGSEQLVDLVVVDAVAVAIDGADIVVIVEDDERLGAMNLCLDLFDVLAEVSRAQLGVIAVEANQHIHGELQFIVGGAAVPFVELSGVRKVRFANQDAVAGILCDHRAHAADHVMDLRKIISVGVCEVGIALGVGSTGLRVVTQRWVLQRGWEWRRDGSRRHRGRARTAWRRTSLFSTAGLRQLRSGCCL